jgi:transposase
MDDMRDFLLTKKQLIQLHAEHKSERNKNSAYKINAVILLGSGWTLSSVKTALLLDEETLSSYVKKYKSGGLGELLKTNYQGRVNQLSELQQEQLCDELESKIYLTTQAVINYVKNEFNINYSISGMRALLKNLGYSYKKPKLVPGKPDLEAQQDFAEYYEAFMNKKSSDIEVIFIDAVHPEHNAMAAYGWIKKGQKRELKTNSGRQRLNLHGAINIETFEVTIIESDSINRDSTIELLETLNQKYFLSKEIKVILDNARYHYSKEVREYLKGAPRIKLVFLPAYSPELNLIERLWKFFKKKVLYNQYHEDLKSFREACIQFFSNIGQHEDELRSLLGGGFEGIYT